MTNPREGMNLRLPAPLKVAARVKARAEGRSLTKQIQVLLERYVAKPTKKATV